MPLKNGEGGFVADAAHAGRARGRGPGGVPLPGTATPTGRYRDIAGISNARGNVVGLMPHPEHAVETGFGPGTRRPRACSPRRWHRGSGVSREPPAHRCDRATPGATAGLRHGRRRPGQNPDARPAVGRARPARADEYARIREILGRRPTVAELAMYSVMWSEHCSYKSSKVHLRTLRRAHHRRDMRDVLLVGIGENAGVVDIGQGWAVTFKVESHNHPSYIEPHQGAATGVGGIVRDIMAMGARPVAVMDSLRFGAMRPPRHRPRRARRRRRRRRVRQLPRACPTSAARSSSTPATRATRSSTRSASGRCGTRTCTWPTPPATATTSCSSAPAPAATASAGCRCWPARRSTEGGPSKRPAVQVGDPFAEKVLIECCLELFAAGVVEGIQDLGGAGLSCATSELASAGDGGMRVRLDRVPLRDPSLRPRRS